MLTQILEAVCFSPVQADPTTREVSIGGRMMGWLVLRKDSEHFLMGVHDGSDMLMG